VYLTTDNGVSWQHLWNGLSNNNILSLAINSSNYIFAGTAAGVFLSTNNGTNWTQINTGLTSDIVNCLEVDSNDDVFAGTAAGGIFRSTNNGSSWMQVKNGLTNTFINSLAINSGGYEFAGTTGGGIFLSTNNGINWTQINNGLTNAQSNLRTGTLTQNWSPYLNVWVNVDLISYYYDSNNNLILRLYGLITPDERHLLSYDPNNNLIEELWQNVVSGNWRNTTLRTHSYDNQNNLDTSLIQNWNTQISEWENAGLSVYSYDLYNNLIEEITMQWNGSDWDNSQRFTYTYDGNHNKSQYLVEHWQNGSWTNYLKVEYTYGTALNKSNNVQANLIEETKQQWNGAEWINVQKQTYSYIPTSVEADLTVTTYSLSQNYPNPFNPSTTIRWQMPEREFVTLKIYDVLGREVTTLVNEELTAGTHETVFDASGISSGVYFYQIKAEGFIETKKMILLR
jgi:hypothetical protein